MISSVTRNAIRRQRLLAINSRLSNINTVPCCGASALPALLQQSNYNNSLLIPTIAKRWHGGPHVDHDTATTIHVKFLQPDDTLKEVDARVGESFLQVAHRHDIDLEGACEGVCACSTCHLIFPVDVFDKMLEEPSEDEEDMLDMAFGLTETSRLGCQVMVTEEMDGITVEMPKATRNFYVDGHVPKPH
jgi:ferredoxin-2, mitochondrial